MKVGEYVRTDDGLIGKVVSEPYEYKDSIVCDIDFGNNDIYNEYEMYQSIIKSSPNIIDLIEVGDYVNGERVTPLMIRMRDEQGVFGLPDSCEIYIDEIKVKSIVTSEQFSQVEYRIGE